MDRDTAIFWLSLSVGAERATSIPAHDGNSVHSGRGNLDRMSETTVIRIASGIFNIMALRFNLSGEAYEDLSSKKAIISSFMSWLVVGILDKILVRFWGYILAGVFPLV